MRHAMSCHVKYRKEHVDIFAHDASLDLSSVVPLLAVGMFGVWH